MAMELGQLGVWRPHFDGGTDGLRELEGLGFGTFWVGASPSLAQARPFLQDSTTMTVATGILNVWRHDPVEVAAQHAELASEFPGRFLLGIGVGHPEATSEYSKPLTAMRRFFDGLDAAAQPVPREERIAAALGPKMLDLARERSLGAFPYFTTPDHTRFARGRLGPDALLATELAVVIDTDAETAGRTARAYATTYLTKRNYARNLRRLGFTDDDIAGSSDRLIDAVIPHGSAEAVAEVVRAHMEAGADHVCVQPLGADRLGAYRELAKTLLG
jgi:probable F420-dependent oxidoreductase